MKTHTPKLATVSIILILVSTCFFVYQSTQAGKKNIKLITCLAVLSIQDKASSEHQGAINQLGAQTKQSVVNAALVPSCGGGLNCNQIIGTPEVINACNCGEARDAGKHIRPQSQSVPLLHGPTVTCSSTY
ncbi:hypothetical protein O181_028949 [Austropuccinia psidii MF-1]|uniref:Uncharacterized protein n=1 Tax=Austropuccinia psidii MF-1 TaxID=1389203 RepID=A0A9Q3H441_9BASI|nr:hypothetical protein [Austropuccinia psidii MF-1]